MAVTLIVEDGTGRSDANALISLEYFKSYCDSQGKDYSSFSDDQLNAAIVRASAFLTYAFKWEGIKMNGRSQLMAFPRYGLNDRDGWPIQRGEMPRELTAAAAEITLVEATTPGSMSPSVTPSERVRSEQVGPIRVEYANIFNSPNDSRPVLLAVLDLLWPFFREDASTNVLSGSAQRV